MQCFERFVLLAHLGVLEARLEAGQAQLFERRPGKCALDLNGCGAGGDRLPFIAEQLEAGRWRYRSGNRTR